MSSPIELSAKDVASGLLWQLKVGKLKAVGRREIEAYLYKHRPFWRSPADREAFIFAVCRQIVNESARL